jgi:hypothetical protein
MPEPSSVDNVTAAFGLLSHLYLTPVLVKLIEGRVPDHLGEGRYLPGIWRSTPGWTNSQ